MFILFTNPLSRYRKSTMWVAEELHLDAGPGQQNRRLSFHYILCFGAILNRLLLNLHNELLELWWSSSVSPTIPCRFRRKERRDRQAGGGVHSECEEPRLGAESGAPAEDPERLQQVQRVQWWQSPACHADVWNGQSEHTFPEFTQLLPFHIYLSDFSGRFYF